MGVEGDAVCVTGKRMGVEKSGSHEGLESILDAKFVVHKVGTIRPELGDVCVVDWFGDDGGRHFEGRRRVE